MDFISIIMPTFNCGHYIKKSVSSILNQTHKEFELIIIDDGSVDNTSEVIETIKDSRISYLYIEKQGIVKSLNYGIGKASSEIIARMDSDDLADPKRLEIQISKMDTMPFCGVISCWYYVFSKKSIKYLVRLPVENEEIKKGLKLHGVISHSGVMFKKKLFNEVGGYLENTLEDYDLWIRLSAKTSFYNIPMPLIFKRDRPTSITNIDYQSYRNLAYNTIRSHYPLYQKEDEAKTREDYLLEGWREYFYGDYLLARYFWTQKISGLLNIRVILAIMTTYLPAKILFRMIRMNLRFITTKFFIPSRDKNTFKKLL